MTDIMHISWWIGWEIEMVKKIHQFMQKEKLHSDIVCLRKNSDYNSISTKNFFDEQIPHIWVFKKIRESIKNVKVVYFHYIFNFFSLLIFLYIKVILRKKVIAVFHTNINGVWLSFKKCLYTIRKFIIVNTVSILADRLVFLTNRQKWKFLKITFMKNKIAQKSLVINNFIEDDRITKFPKIFEKWKKLRCICVGRLTKTKGFFDFCEVVKKMKDFPIEFSAVGKSEHPLQWFASRNIVYLWNVNQKQIIELYDQNDILIFPSYRETFGMVILEAMARGLVVVCSNLPPIREFFIEWRNWFIFEPGDTEKIKNILDRALKDRDVLTNISKNNIEDILQFVSKKKASAYVDIYYELLKEDDKKNI